MHCVCPLFVKTHFHFWNHTYICDVHTKQGCGGLEICHVFADSIVFKQ